MSAPPVSDNDPLLHAFLSASDEAVADRELGHLLNFVAAPRIRRIIGRKIGVPATGGAGSGLLDVDDITADAVAVLMRRLLALRAGNGRAIADFRGYCAVSAQSAWINHLRLLRPARARLMHQVRYLLVENRRHTGFALWPAPDDSDDELCGFEAWRNDPHMHPAAAERLRALADDPTAFLADFLPRPEAASEFHPGRLLAAIFDRLGGPAPPDAIVDAIGALWDTADITLRDEPAPNPADFPATLPAPDDAAGWADGLRWLWREVCALPQPQRLAFVLHSEVTHEWAWSGTVTSAEIAAVLELPLAELQALWSGIPLPDVATSARLGISRQQVINLRKAARIALGRKFRETLTATPVFPPSSSRNLRP